MESSIFSRSFWEIMRHQGRNWLTYPLCVFIAILLIVLAMLILPFKYTANITVASSQSFNVTQSAALSQLGSLGGGIGSLISGNASETTDPFQVFLSLLDSRFIATAIQKNPDLMHRMFPDRWDDANKRWHKPRALTRRLVGITVPDEPTIQDILDYLDKSVDIEPLDKTASIPVAIFQVSVVTKDPYFSRDLLRFIVGTADDLTRKNFRAAYTDQVAQIRYLLATEADVNLQNALLQMITTVLTQEMLTRSKGPYAVIVVDNVPFDLTPSSPRPTLYLAVAAILGVLLAFFVNLFSQVLFPSHSGDVAQALHDRYRRARGYFHRFGTAGNN